MSFPERRSVRTFLYADTELPWFTIMFIILFCSVTCLWAGYVLKQWKVLLYNFAFIFTLTSRPDRKRNKFDMKKVPFLRSVYALHFAHTLMRKMLLYVMFNIIYRELHLH